MTTNTSPTITGDNPSVPATLSLSPGRWTLDATHATVSFWIRHLGISKVRGQFARFEAVLDVGATAEETQVSATIDLASVDTGNTDRDAHLRSPDFLDVERHPQMTFRSTSIAARAAVGADHSISGAGDEWTLTGDLTIAGTTRPVTFAVEVGGLGDYFGTAHAGFSAQGRIDRRDFMQWTLQPGAEKVIGDIIHFDLDLQFIEPGKA